MVFFTIFPVSSGGLGVFPGLRREDRREVHPRPSGSDQVEEGTDVIGER